MSIAGLNWDEAAYTSTSGDAWSSFIKSRFEVLASRKLNVGPTIQSRMLDLELSMLQKNIRIAHQYRNAFSGAAALPAEILATIFTFAQVGWQPDLRFRLMSKPDLGWVSVTHVCNSWRRAAISTPPLWTAISCSHLSLRILPEFVHRARNSGLQLDYQTWLCHKKLPIDVWLHESILRRSRQISFSTENKKQLVQALNLMKLSSPLPSLRGLAIHYEVEEDDWLPFEDGDFVSRSFPALCKLSLMNCFPRWSASSLPGQNLTHLSLSMSWYTSDLDDETFQPAAPLFRDMLVALPLLIELTLENFLPSPDFVIEPNGIHTPVILSERFVLPAPLRKLAINIDTFCAYWSNYWYFWNNFLVNITTVVLVDLGIDSFNDRMKDVEDEGDWLICFTCIDDPFVPALEMTLSRNTVSMRYMESPEATWTRRSNIEKCQPSVHNKRDIDWRYQKENWDTDDAHGSRHLYVPSDVPIYIDVLPIKSLRALFLVSSAMLSITSPDDWITSFAQAQDVRRLSFACTASHHLLVALSRTDARSDEPRYPCLFPQLDTLILHADEDPSRENARSRQPALELSLLDVIAVRKDVGAPVVQMFADKSMSEWDVWARLDDGMVVSFFE